jgi:hypothetical protein
MGSDIEDHMNPLRVYCPVSESRTFRTRGKEKRQQLDNDDDPVAGINGEDQDVEKFMVAGPGSAQEVKDEDFNPRVISLQDQVFITELLTAMKDEHNHKAYGMPGKSLENRVLDWRSSPKGSSLLGIPWRSRLLDPEVISTSLLKLAPSAQKARKRICYLTQFSIMSVGPSLTSLSQRVSSTIPSLR